MEAFQISHLRDVPKHLSGDGNIFSQISESKSSGMQGNEDNFSVTHFKSVYTLVCAFDGHGEFGRCLKMSDFFFSKPGTGSVGNYDLTWRQYFSSFVYFM